MEIGLNALSFKAGAMGGVETYFRNLLYYVKKIDQSDTYTIICDKAAANDFKKTYDFDCSVYEYGKPSINW